MAHVAPFPHGDPGIGPQAGIQLSPADIDRNDFRRTPLQQAIHEAARRSAGVDGAPPCNGDPEFVQRSVQLLSAAGDEPCRLTAEPDWLGGRHHARRLLRDRAAHENPAVRNECLRRRARRGHATAHQLVVQASSAGVHAAESTSAPAAHRSGLRDERGVFRRTRCRVSAAAAQCQRHLASAAPPPAAEWRPWRTRCAARRGTRRPAWVRRARERDEPA